MKPIIVVFVVLLLAAITPIGRYAIGAFRPVKAVSLDTAMKSISTSTGRPALIVLYGPRCPLSRHVFPQVVRLADQGVEVEAYCVDDGLDAMLVGGFMNEFHAGFPAQRILPWQPGQLSSRMGELGVNVTEFKAHRKDLLEKQLEKLEQKLAALRSDDDWNRKFKEAGINSTKEALASKQ